LQMICNLTGNEICRSVISGGIIPPMQQTFKSSLSAQAAAATRATCEPASA
jgi:hypothetical protein